MEMCQLAEITARRYLYDVEEKDDDDDGSIHVVKCLVKKIPGQTRDFLCSCTCAVREKA